MSGRPAVLVLDSVLRTIEQEAEPYRRSQTETGGILMGAWLDYATVLVLAATGPGPNAEHYGAEYALDHEWAQQQLEKLSTQLPSVDYVGEWHRHPGTMDYPSGGDWQTAHRILHDDAYQINELINPIVILPNGDFKIRFFHLHRRDADARRDFSPIGFDAVTQDDQRVVRFLEKEHEMAQAGIRPRAAFATAEGRRRLDEESEALARAFPGTRASPPQPPTEDYVFEVTVGGPQGLGVFLVCPFNYPESPPRVIATMGGQEVDYASRILPRWDGKQHRLRDVMAEVMTQAGVAVPAVPAVSPVRERLDGRTRISDPVGRRALGALPVTAAALVVLALLLGTVAILALRPGAPPGQATASPRTSASAFAGSTPGATPAASPSLVETTPPLTATQVPSGQPATPNRSAGPPATCMDALSSVPAFQSGQRSRVVDVLVTELAPQGLAECRSRLFRGSTAATRSTATLFLYGSAPGTSVNVQFQPSAVAFGQPTPTPSPSYSLTLQAPLLGEEFQRGTFSPIPTALQPGRYEVTVFGGPSCSQNCNRTVTVELSTQALLITVLQAAEG